MQRVISKDGTPIAFDQLGSGPAVILVAGALGTRASFTELAETLAQNFTVINYDRRGRAGSGDTQPYAVAREIEDIEALIDHAGGSASLYGISSGAALALEAAAALPNKVVKVALYEPPFIVDETHPPLPANYVEHLNELVQQGRRGDAVEYFMTAAVGIPPDYIAPMRATPMWQGFEAVAHTIAYDGLVVRDHMRGQPLSPATWQTATMPALVIVGGNSEPFFHNGTKALADLLPNARHYTLPGQDHNVATSALAPVLVDFFGG